MIDLELFNDPWDGPWGELADLTEAPGVGWMVGVAGRQDPDGSLRAW